MFDIGWPEMAVIMLVAIIVIGPKDLPRMARTIGKWTGKARAMARDFQRSLDDMAREADLDDIKKSIDKVGSPNKARAAMASSIKNAMDPDDELEGAMKIEDSKPKKPAVAKTISKAETSAATTASSSAATDMLAKSSTGTESAAVEKPAPESPVSETKNSA